jgi:hypothetical protein
MEIAPSKTLYAYDRTFMDQKSFSSGESPNEIENAIIEYLVNQEVEPKVHASKFKMSFEFKNEG